MIQKVYLAGGFSGDWQDKVKALDRFIFFDPKVKERPNGVEVSMTLEEYGTWDLHHIKQADIVFVYVAATNPSCIGLSVESGYAYGLGKTVISVIEPENQFFKDKYLQFIKKTSHVSFESLERGIEYLASFAG